MNKNTRLNILTFIISIATSIFLQEAKSLSVNNQFSSPPKHYVFSSKDIVSGGKKINILLFTTFWGMGSVEVYNWNTQRLMAQTEFNHQMIVCDKSELHKKMCEEKISHYCFSTFFGEKNFEEIIQKQLRSFCIQQKIDILQTHTFDDTKRAIKSLNGLRTKIVFMFHQDHDQPITDISKISGVLALNHIALDFMKKNSQKNKLGIKHFKQVFLLPDRKKYINYKQPKLSKFDYFKKNYGIELDDSPVICMAAQFYGEEKHIESKYRKNQSLLIHAAANLIYEKHRPVHILFAGAGPSQAFHEDLTKKLGLEKYIHFLGYCKNTDDIYYYSDFHVLTSIGEALGAVHMEAGLMKKPSLGAFGTGAEYLVADKKTGLLFKNNNLQDLIEKIEFLIDNPELCKKMGQNAYRLFTGKETYGKKNLTFIDKIQVKELSQFYHQVINR